MNSMRPNEERARMAVIMIWAVIAMEVIAMVSTYFQYDLLQAISNGADYTDQQLENNDLRVQLVAIIYAIFFIMSSVVFIMWFRRAYYNLHQRCSVMRFTDAWAAGSWFVPILNLFRPYQIMQELFEVNERLLRKNQVKSFSRFPTYLIGLWWCLWLINNAMIQILNKMNSGVDEVQQLSNESLFYIFQSVIAITAGMLVIYIIKAYNTRELLLEAANQKEGDNFVDVMS